MTAAANPTVQGDASVSTPGIASRVAVFVATILVIIGLAVLPLLTPWFVHPALDAAAAAERLGVATEVAHALSDRSIEALVLGGSFDITGPDGAPLYGAAEIGHLADARILLWALLAAGAISLGLIAVAFARHDRPARASLWRIVSNAGLASMAAVLALGLLSLVAFSSLFTLFHQVFFPAGNWTFDPATQRLVQLYPFGFWQLAAATLGVLVLTLSIGTWLVARSMAMRSALTPP